MSIAYSVILSQYHNGIFTVLSSSNDTIESPFSS
nr:MAG TPA_asm: hypothetical protein [Caudoviricetes sp.]